MTFFIINIILAILGLWISFGIYKKKNSKEKIVCYLGDHCETVIHSKFSNFFGVSIEKIGFVYYGLILIGYALSIIANGAEKIAGLSTVGISLSIFLLSVVGFAFSIYLIFVQALYLRKWCPWCVSSAITSSIIFILSSRSFMVDFSAAGEILSNYNSVLITIQLLAVAIGVSTATISAFLIIKFLKDFRIDTNEDKKLTILDQIIWFSIILTLMVNLCFYISNPVNYLNSTKLMSQLGIFIILLINNSLLSLYINPRLIGIRIDMKSINILKTFWLRQIAFAMGVVSIISWYAILFIDYFNKNTNLDAYEAIANYVAICFVAVVISQFAIILVDRIRVSSDNVYKFK